MHSGERAGGADRLPDVSTRGEPSTHQLRLFVVLAEELHFGRAAARVFVSQPALSQQIRALESRLGVRLVNRTNRAVQLTAAGTALLTEARAVLAAMERVRRLAGEHARQVRGHLILGSIAAEAAMPYAEAVLAHLAGHHPHLQVEMRSVDFVEQVRALSDGEVDAAFLRPPLPPEIHTVPLATESRVVCLPADDPLAGRSALTLDRLRDHVVIDVPPQVPRLWWDYWTVNPRPDGTPVRYGPVVSDIEPMLLAVARGQGIAFLPKAASRLYPRPGIAYVDVTDLPPTTAALAWLPKNHDRPAIVALHAAALAVTRAALPHDPA
jgi:DNA-binding transcriptional LysR family regulator